MTLTICGLIKAGDSVPPRQLLPPHGYLPAIYGPWPVTGATIIKTFQPPFWTSSRNWANYKDTSSLWNNAYNANFNPLMMDPELSQLIDSFCTCKAGLRTCAMCTHRLASLMLLCNAQAIDTAKVPEAVVVDTAR